MAEEQAGEVLSRERLCSRQPRLQRCLLPQVQTQVCMTRRPLKMFTRSWQELTANLFTAHFFEQISFFFDLPRAFI